MLFENTTKIAHEINNLRPQILEALPMKPKKKLITIELILKIAILFWNAFRFIDSFYLDIPYFLIIFCYHW